MKYQSKKIIVDAFKLEFTMEKFHQWLRQKPEWFVNAFHVGKILITDNPAKKQYITIETDIGQVHAMSGDWIIYKPNGSITVRTDSDFELEYKSIQGN